MAIAPRQTAALAGGQRLGSGPARLPSADGRSGWQPMVWRSLPAGCSAHGGAWTAPCAGLRHLRGGALTTLGSGCPCPALMTQQPLSPISLSWHAERHSHGEQLVVKAAGRRRPCTARPGGESRGACALHGQSRTRRARDRGGGRTRRHAGSERNIRHSSEWLPTPSPVHGGAAGIIAQPGGFIPDQLAWIANHAAQTALSLDLTFCQLAEAVAAQLPGAP